MIIRNEFEDILLKIAEQISENEYRSGMPYCLGDWKK